MTQAEVLDLTTICSSFPRYVHDPIIREHILNTIDTIFDGETELLILEGEDGIGKTTLLTQFAQRHPNTTFMIFLKPTSRWAYDPNILLRDLCNQIHWLLTQKELTPDHEVDKTFLRNHIFALQRKAQQRRIKYFFILDGLSTIPDQGDEIQDQILDLLPLGLPFKFIISWDNSSFPKGNLLQINYKTFPISGFTLDETRKFFSNLQIEQWISEIHKTCKGIPGYLATVKRILDTGVDIENLISDMPSKLPKLFEIEWARINIENTDLIRLLALLAHDKKRHTATAVAKTLGVPHQNQILELLNGISFILVDLETEEIDFVSDAFRKFVVEQLQSYRKGIIELLINELLSEPNSEDALLLLPGYFEQAGRYDDLLNYLSPENFTQIIECTRSYNPLRQQASLGVEIAKKMARDGELIRFCVQKSMIMALDGSKPWRSEVEALIALNNYDGALALAQSTILKEDLLHLLAVIARKRVEQGLPLDQELSVQIRNVYSQINPMSLETRAIDIASDLIFSFPDLAIDLVERSADTAPHEEALDWALAKLSIAALTVSKQQKAMDFYERILQRIHDPKARNITTAASMLLGNYDASQVIAEASKLDNATEGIYLLRLWAMENREREDAYRVVDSAIDFAIKTVEYTPGARDFRQLATPMPFVLDPIRVKDLVAKFDTLNATLSQLGPSEDYTRLQLLLAQSESKFDPGAAGNRLLEIYLFFINELKDIAIRATCIARVYCDLDEIDTAKTLEQQYGFHSMVVNDLKTCKEILLNNTGDHYEVTKGVIQALAKKKPDDAFDIASSLNLQSRRDQAVSDLIDSIIDQPPANVDFTQLKDFILSIQDKVIKQEAVLGIIARVSAAENDLDQLLGRVLPIITMVDDIESAPVRCNAFGIAYSFVRKVQKPEFNGLKNQLKEKLYSSWESIDIAWSKVDFGFKTTEIFASVESDLARDFLQKTEQYRDGTLLEESLAADTYISSLRLTIRAYSGLLLRSSETKDDIERLCILIDRISSNGERAKIWADVALAYLFYERVNDCKRIVIEFVRPCLAQIKGDQDAWADAIISVAPSLYYAHKTTALEDIAKLPKPRHDQALTGICEFILTKKFLSDPYEEAQGKGYDVSYEELIDICELLSYMTVDRAIYNQIEAIADSISSNRGRERYTRDQKNDIGRRLDNIIQQKLPDIENIKHQGFRIVAIAQVYRIVTGKQPDWNRLLSDAHQIPNSSDKAFVLAILASIMPHKEAQKRKQLIEDAEQLVLKIPALVDQIDRYEALSSYALDIDQAISKRCMDLGMKAAIASDDPELYSAQRRIIDMAYAKFGPEFATSLASLADNDPARKTAKMNLANRIQLQEIKKSIIDQTQETYQEKDEFKYYPRIAWMLLGSLNAGRISHYHPEKVRKFAEISSKLPLQKAYPILAWIIQNAVKRFNDTDQSRTLLRNIFDSMFVATELAARMTKCSTVQIRQAKTQAIRSTEQSSLVIRPGERLKAMQYIREWADSELGDYLKICDPFFGPSDMDLLQLVQLINPNCRIQILTSKKHHEHEGIALPWDESYRIYWRTKISDQTPLETDITVAGTEKQGELPIHDRWWITEGGGLRVGTSFRSLGLSKESEISRFTKAEAELREQEIDRYLYRKVREHNGERIMYSTFSI